MLGKGVSLISSRHRKRFQSLLALSLVLGGATGTALRGSSDPDYGQIPVAFIANHGQTHRTVRFTAKAPGLTAYFTQGAVVVDTAGATIRMRYPGSDPSAAPDGLDRQAGRANFLIGDDPGQWRTGVPLYSRVVYRELYPGIDMVYSSHRRLLKSEFVVAPGADPARIQIAYSGVDGLRLDESGGLIFRTASDELREDAPEIYQDGPGGRRAVGGAFRLSGDVVSFFVEDYDRTQPLRIDPVLSYSTYVGGGGTDRASGIAVDSTGAAYIIGYTDSGDYPVTAGVIRTVSGGSVDVFVTKLNPAGSAIVYSTYLGGSGDDRGYSIAVDASGNAFLTGYTTSTNFPTATPLQAANGGGRDAFVSKLNAAGTALTYSTYLGGAGTDSGNGIAIDSGGAAYITGSTTSGNFPVLGAFQAAPGGSQDAFATKLNAAGSALVYSTYLGGALDDRGSSIAVDSAGSAYIAGNTNSANFPTQSPLQAANNGAQDAFVTKLSANGAGLLYSTYLGGTGTETVELGRSIAVDSAGSAYVTGTTSSTNLPLQGPLQAVNNGGGNDAFVTKLTAAGTALAYSTYLGGGSVDFGESIAVDSSGAAFVAGYTSSFDFPAVNAGQPAIGGNYDAFVAKLNPAGSAVADSGFLGGAGADAGYGVAIDSTGRAYVTGQTGSTDFPLLGAVQGSGGTTLAAFAARFTFGATGPPTASSVTPSSGTGSAQVFSLLYSDSRGFADINFVEVNWSATLSTANSCYLRYNRAANTIQLSNDAGSGWIGSATPGLAGTLQNSQCILNASASSVSGSGNNLTVSLSLNFKQAFAGAKNIYMQVQDVASTLAPWQVRGTWTVFAELPSSVSVTPSTGSGGTQTFVFVYTDPNGFADINWVAMLFQSSLTGLNACFVEYTRATNAAVMVSDSGSGFVPGSVTLGSSATLANTQCTLNALTSSVSASGNTLTVNLSVTFAAAFSGSKNIYMAVVNNAGVFVNWQTMGTWTVPAGSLLPSSVSVTPSSGSGSSQAFTFVYTDPGGVADINWVAILFQSSLTGQNACFVEFTRATNAAVVVADSGSGFVGSATLGSSTTLSNSQCAVHAATSSSTASGNNLTITLSLTFAPGFAGAKTVYMAQVNNAGVFVQWQAMGAWTVPTSGSLLPSSVSVAPSSGSGATQAFTFVYTDPNGFADINWVAMLFQSALTGQHACFVEYTRASNTAVLVADSGSGFVPGSVTLGSSATLSNSQCTLNGIASSSSVSGNNLTITLSLTFTPSFSGIKNTYMAVVNNAGVFVDWLTKGTWSVPSGAALPSSVSVSPASGAGGSQTFTFVYTDSNGFNDINWVAMLFQSSLFGSNACFVEYTRATNVAVLVSDSGSGFVPGSVTLGSAGTLSNSQCTLNGITSSASASGNNLTVTLSLTFAPSFSGAKNSYMAVVNNAGVFVDWQAKGAWTVP